MLNICGGPGVYLPADNCDDCSALEQRVKKLETLLDGVRRVTLSKTDGDSSQSGFFLGEVE